MRGLADLAPLARHSGGVARLLQHLRHRMLVGGSCPGAAVPPGLVVQTARAERIPPGHQQAAARPAHRRCVAGLETQAGFGEAVDVGGPVVIRSVTTHVIEAHIVPEDKHNIGPGGISLGGNHRRSRPQGQQGHRDDTCKPFHRLERQQPKIPPVATVGKLPRKSLNPAMLGTRPRNAVL